MILTKSFKLSWDCLFSLFITAESQLTYSFLCKYLLFITVPQVSVAQFPLTCCNDQKWQNCKLVAHPDGGNCFFPIFLFWQRIFVCRHKLFGCIFILIQLLISQNFVSGNCLFSDSACGNCLFDFNQDNCLVRILHNWSPGLSLARSFSSWRPSVRFSSVFMFLIYLKYPHFQLRK